MKKINSINYGGKIIDIGLITMFVTPGLLMLVNTILNCGALLLMALGMKFGQSDIEELESRKKTNDITVEFLNLFKTENSSYLCRELLGCDLSTDEGKKYAMDKQLFVEFCPKMVESATLIAEKPLNC